MTGDVENLLDKVRIVLIRTSESGNIGSAARAMKTMGLSNLVLVDPVEFPSAKATARASGADDILSRARVVATLPEALTGCDLVMGTSARLRDLPWPLLDPRQAAAKSLEYCSQADDIAIVFGSERSGMTNEEMDHCHFQIHIPANDEYSSLNLAASVQVISYEMRMTQLLSQGIDLPEPEEELAKRDEMERFYEHLFHVMQVVKYYRPEQPKLLRRRIKRLFNRPLMTHPEVQIMRGFLSMIEQHLPDKEQDA